MGKTFPPPTPSPPFGVGYLMPLWVIKGPPFKKTDFFSYGFGGFFTEVFLCFIPKLPRNFYFEHTENLKSKHNIFKNRKTPARSLRPLQRYGARSHSPPAFESQISLNNPFHPFSYLPSLSPFRAPFPLSFPAPLLLLSRHLSAPPRQPPTRPPRPHPPTSQVNSFFPFSPSISPSRSPACPRPSPRTKGLVPRPHPTPNCTTCIRVPKLCGN